MSGPYRRTAPGRLRVLDAMLLAGIPRLGDPEAFRGAPVIDVGIGSQPWTTVELARRLYPVEVVGVERSAALVEQARRSWSRDNLRFMVGGLDLPFAARLVRVMNVLRDGDAEAVPEAHRRLGAGLVEGGWLVEGSCSLDGEVGAAHAMEHRGAHGGRRAVLLWTGRQAPRALHRRLPLDLRADEAHPVHRMLAAWMEAFLELPPHPERAVQAARGIPFLEVLGPGFIWYGVDRRR